MNRDDLDGWFARADDVLTDWHGSPDAMDSAQPFGIGAAAGHAWQFTESGVTDLGATQTAYCLACHYIRYVFVPHGSGVLWNLPTWLCPGEPRDRATRPGRGT